MFYHSAIRFFSSQTHTTTTMAPNPLLIENITKPTTPGITYITPKLTITNTHQPPTKDTPSVPKSEPMDSYTNFDEFLYTDPEEFRHEFNLVCANSFGG